MKPTSTQPATRWLLLAALLAAVGVVGMGSGLATYHHSHADHTHQHHEEHDHDHDPKPQDEDCQLCDLISSGKLIKLDTPAPAYLKPIPAGHARPASNEPILPFYAKAPSFPRGPPATT